MVTLGSSEHSRKLQVKMLQNILIYRIFLSLRRLQERWNTQKDIRLNTDVNQNYLENKIQRHFRFLMLYSANNCEGHHWRLSQMMSLHVNVKTRATIQFYVKLGLTLCRRSRKSQLLIWTIKMSRRLSFKWQKHFWEGRESLEEESRSGRPTVIDEAYY